MHKHLFPFSAIIGQADLKLCLILNAVNPKVGGVVIRGEKGTAKSTAVRALSALLPEVESQPMAELHDGTKSQIVEKHRPSVVTLPLNATEDCVVGGIDFNLTIREGHRVFQPGLLAKAHHGILYVDEVNLLDDHIVDVVLDAAASGENHIEREGMSFKHPSEFILVGTMNPEEGELRPQLLDRFGLCVEVQSERDPEHRVDLILRREAFDSDPIVFIESYQAENDRLAQKIAKAKKLFTEVKMPPHLRSFISELCRENNVAGHRADLVIEHAARAHAAYRSQLEVGVEDIKIVAPFALSHRRRDPIPPPPPEPPQPEEQDEPEQQEQEQPEPEENRQQEQPQPEAQNQPEGEGEEREQPQQEQQGNNQEEQDSPDEKNEDDERSPEEAHEQVLEQIFDIGATFKVKKFSTPKDRNKRRGSGRRSRSKVSQKQGRYIRSTSKRSNDDIALDATLRAAAPHQRHRDNPNGMAVALHESDIHEKIREKRVGNLLLFVVDASGSMGARGRMAASKGAVMSLLLDAYQKRDKVAMVSFRKKEAWVNLPITSSVEVAGKLLKDMPVGGRTPFSAGLVKGYELCKNYLLKEPTARPIMIIISDGKANFALGNQKPMDEVYAVARKMAEEARIRFIVVDTEEAGLVSFGLASKISAMLSADYFKIDDLKSDQLLSIVKDSMK
ncbi:putative cobaltochelatase [Chloroherpeton thalassium]